MGTSSSLAPRPSPLILGLIIALAIPFRVQAQDSTALALYGVKEIVVRPLHLDDPAVAASCRLQAADIDAVIMKELQDNKLPVVAEADARPPMMDIARINLVPLIVPYNSQGFDCVTWIALSAESRNHLRVLPVEIPRVVKVLYWQHGALVASAQSVHFDHVSGALHDMIHEFAQQYIAAQPPTVGRPTTPAPR